MRIRNIRINQWRAFQNIELQLDDDAGLVCIVGANGTGKSHLLELIAACAHRLGLSQGIEIPRGDPFADSHDFSLRFYIAPGVSAAVDHGLAGEVGFGAWDRTLTIQSRKLPGNEITSIEADGIVDAAQRTEFARRVIERMQRSEEVHFLSLDADRAYPKKNYDIRQVAEAYEIDWGDLNIRAAVHFGRPRRFMTNGSNTFLHKKINPARG